MGLLTACLLFLFLILPPGQLNAVNMRHLERRSEADEEGGRLILVQAVFRCGEETHVGSAALSCMHRSKRWTGRRKRVGLVHARSILSCMQSQSSMLERSLLSCPRDQSSMPSPARPMHTGTALARRCPPPVSGRARRSPTAPTRTPVGFTQRQGSDALG